MKNNINMNNAKNIIVINPLFTTIYFTFKYIKHYYSPIKARP